MIFMQNFYVQGFLYEYSILFIFVHFKSFLVYPFLLRIPWYRYVFLYSIIRIHFKILEQILKSWFSLSWLHNMVRIQDIQAKLGWLHSLWFNLILSKERKKTVYTLKAFSRILQFSCMLPMFLVESIPKQKLLKGLHATTETMQLSETSVVCRPHALIVLVIHLSHH